MSHDGIWDDYDEAECFQCGGEGFVNGCSWDWQCATYDAGEGTCLCTRRCDICNALPTPCPRCNGEGVIQVEDRPYPNDVSPTSHSESCPECSPIPPDLSRLSGLQERGE